MVFHEKEEEMLKTMLSTNVILYAEENSKQSWEKIVYLLLDHTSRFYPILL